MDPLELVDQLFPLPDDDIRAGDFVIDPHSRRLARVAAINGDHATLSFPYSYGEHGFVTVALAELRHAFP